MSDEKSGGKAGIKFILDSNLGLPVAEKPWSTILSEAGITAEPTTNLTYIDRVLADHQADIAYVPAPDFYRAGAKRDHHYRGLAIATSKFTGQPIQRSLLVVRKDDPATGLKDLARAKCGYINKSCTSSYFPLAILLNRQGIKLDEYLAIEPVKPWQGQVDAVRAGTVRATMILEDVWKMTPQNQDETKVIGQFDGCIPPVVVVRDGLDEAVRRRLLDALISWIPPWEGVYGAFKPYYYADAQAFFHDLDLDLLPDII